MVAPNRRIAASFVAGAVSGTIAVQGIPSRRACHARAWAMLPALHVNTPCVRSSGVRSATALPAPRTLNDPVGCRFSNFKKISGAASSTFRRTRGVRTTKPSIRFRADSIAARSRRVNVFLRQGVTDAPGADGEAANRYPPKANPQTRTGHTIIRSIPPGPSPKYVVETYNPRAAYERRPRRMETYWNGGRTMRIARIAESAMKMNVQSETSERMTPKASVKTPREIAPTPASATTTDT